MHTHCIKCYQNSTGGIINLGGHKLSVSIVMWSGTITDAPTNKNCSIFGNYSFRGRGEISEMRRSEIANITLLKNWFHPYITQKSSGASKYSRTLSEVLGGEGVFGDVVVKVVDCGFSGKWKIKLDDNRDCWSSGNEVFPNDRLNYVIIVTDFTTSEHVGIAGLTDLSITYASAAKVVSHPHRRGFQVGDWVRFRNMVYRGLAIRNEDTSIILRAITSGVKAKLNFVLLPSYSHDVKSCEREATVDFDEEMCSVTEGLSDEEYNYHNIYDNYDEI